MCITKSYKQSYTMHDDDTCALSGVETRGLLYVIPACTQCGSPLVLSYSSLGRSSVLCSPVLYHIYFPHAYAVGATSVSICFNTHLCVVSSQCTFDSHWCKLRHNFVKWCDAHSKTNKCQGKMNLLNSVTAILSWSVDEEVAEKAVKMHHLD